MISFRDKVIIVPFDIMHTLYIAYIGVYYVICVKQLICVGCDL